MIYCALLLQIVGAAIFIYTLANPGDPGAAISVRVVLGIISGALLFALGSLLFLLAAIGDVGDSVIAHRKSRKNQLAPWAQVRVGMTESELRGLLGPPNEVQAGITWNGELAHRWRYGRFIRKGTITCCGGRVVGFRVPAV